MNSRKPEPASNHHDLHGNAPERSNAALLLIDVINDLNFPQNRHIVRRSLALAKSIAGLKQRCQRAGIPSIYVNDNRGRWRSDFSVVLHHCLRPEMPGSKMTRLLRPSPQDYIVLKPKHSALYATPLETILEYIGAHSLILAGLTTNACVMITASELYVRDFKLFVPRDCVAALTGIDQRNSLALMKKNFAADVRASAKINVSRLRAEVAGKK